jgi:hypothetical protein
MTDEIHIPSEFKEPKPWWTARPSDEKFWSLYNVPAPRTDGRVKPTIGHLTIVRSTTWPNSTCQNQKCSPPARVAPPIPLNIATG